MKAEIGSLSALLVLATIQELPWVILRHLLLPGASINESVALSKMDALKHHTQVARFRLMASTFSGIK
jgi:hypothetical protein